MTDSLAYETFRGNVRTVMDHRKMLQSELADLTGIKQPSVSALLSGRHEPRVSTMERIAVALEVDLTLLLKSELSASEIPRRQKSPAA